MSNRKVPHSEIGDLVEQFFGTQPKQPKEYQIVDGASHEKLEANIKAEMSYGWRCQGGLAIDSHPDVEYPYHQAMVR